jgi:hypothetical protein
MSPPGLCRPDDDGVNMPPASSAACRKSISWFALAGLAGVAAWSQPAIAVSSSPSMVAHRAIYELALDAGNSSDKVSDAQGRMVYDFSGSACDGFTTKLRFVTRVSDEDGNSRLTDVATTTFEDESGRNFDFSTRSFVDGSVSEDSNGKAARIDDKVQITMAKPLAKRFAIAASSQFPNQHLQAIIAAALRGEHFVQVALFDGSDKGEKVYETSAVIGQLNTGADEFGDEATAKLAGIEKVAHWPVTISYFNGDADGEQAPSYELSFIVYENGITRRMRLDYGDFALTGKLVKLEIPATKVSGKKCR